MALLTEAQQKKYRLRHKRSFYACCDNCNRLIPADEPYVVNSWTRRKDKLTFLGAIPTDISCQECNGIKTGEIKMVDDLPVRKVERATGNIEHDAPYFLRKLMLRWFRKYEEGFSEEDLILRISKRSEIDIKWKRKGIIRKTLREMKQLGELRKRRGLWMLRPKKVK